MSGKPAFYPPTRSALSICQSIHHANPIYFTPDRCGGPRLLSFSGSADNLTPRARFNTLLGYTAPFDRHDWVIDRCGTRIEYVIDFYTGRSGTGDNAHERAKPISFYLDVRPKLNTWEGCKMRVFKIFGA